MAKSTSFRIASDATLRDITASHFHIDRFTALVLDAMRKAQREHGPVTVRLGVTGAGKLPNFRLDAISGGWSSAFDGVSRQPFDAGTMDAHWSSKAMDYGDVEALLRELRNYFK
jgi:hypothetical protein